jgi:hypothetical protein
MLYHNIVCLSRDPLIATNTSVAMSVVFISQTLWAALLETDSGDVLERTIDVTIEVSLIFRMSTLKLIPIYAWRI